MVIGTLRGQVQLAKKESEIIQPETNGNKSNFQNIIDKIGQTALNNEWNACSHYVKQLQHLWDDFQPESAEKLNLTKAISRNISNLDFAVVEKDAAEVMDILSQLIKIISDFA